MSHITAMDVTLLTLNKADVQFFATCFHTTRADRFQFYLLRRHRFELCKREERVSKKTARSFGTWSNWNEASFIWGNICQCVCSRSRRVKYSQALRGVRHKHADPCCAWSCLFFLPLLKILSFCSTRPKPNREYDIHTCAVSHSL